MAPYSVPGLGRLMIVHRFRASPRYTNHIVRPGVDYRQSLQKVTAHFFDSDGITDSRLPALNLWVGTSHDFSAMPQTVLLRDLRHVHPAASLATFGCELLNAPTSITEIHDIPTPDKIDTQDDDQFDIPPEIAAKYRVECATIVKERTGCDRAVATFIHVYSTIADGGGRCL